MNGSDDEGWKKDTVLPDVSDRTDDDGDRSIDVIVSEKVEVEIGFCVRMSQKVNVCSSVDIICWFASSYITLLMFSL